MDRPLLYLLIFFLVLALCTPGAHAFGAGNIPSFAFMEGRAFRHGDIEDTLAELAKKGASGFAIGNLLGKSKFGGLDVKRVYFGNWLRDYSQAVDIASLKKLPLQTVINLCMVLGFLAHGYATNEFEVTPERLGVYLPTEHIDNPKGYGDGEDARKYDPRLRGPVDPRELEIDPRTGMKNYIANESGTWDTSKALVRKTLERCIHLGRQHRSTGQKADEYECYRLLGQALHTLEDFPAHSNFCELVLISQGHSQVFTHVGDHVRVHAPNGKSVAPIITGTFGSSDFLHSLLGEATDHLSEASVSDLNKEISKARSRDMNDSSSNTLRDLFFNLPGGSGGDMSRDMEGIERIRAGQATGGKRPEDMSPQELHAILWQVLSFRDSVVKKIEKTIEKIPGLGPLIEKIMDSISVFVFTTLEPYLKPLLKGASSGLSSVSAEVIDTHDQYEVFNDPQASDPTHSFLSKDHFNLILNEPAGNLAKVIVRHTVTLVTKAWDDTSVNVHKTTEEILECLFHPDFHNQGSKVQREMLQYMHSWTQSLGHKQHQILSRLTKNAVRNHENVRLGGEGGKPEAQGTAAYNYGVQAQHNIQGYINQVPGVSQAQSAYHSFQNFTGGPGGRRDMPGEPNASAYAPPPSSYQSPSGPPPGNFQPPSGPPPGIYQSPSGPPSGPAPTSAGEASSYYHNTSSPPPPTNPSFPSPSGPPPSFPGTGYAPSFPSPGMGPGHSPFSPPPGAPPGQQGGGPPSFPSAGPGYPTPSGAYAPPPQGYPSQNQGGYNNQGYQSGYNPSYY